MRASAFIREVAERLRSDDARAEAIISLVLQELRDRVPDVDGPDVTATLPPIVRSLWTRTAGDGDETGPPYRLELLGTIMQYAGLRDSTEAEGAVVAVFAALRAVLTDVAAKTPVVREVFRRLPPDLDRLWRAAERKPRRRAPRRVPLRDNAAPRVRRTKR